MTRRISTQRRRQIERDVAPAPVPDRWEDLPYGPALREAITIARALGDEDFALAVGVGRVHTDNPWSWDNADTAISAALAASGRKKLANLAWSVLWKILDEPGAGFVSSGQLAVLDVVDALVVADLGVPVEHLARMTERARAIPQLATVLDPVLAEAETRSGDELESLPPESTEGATS